MLITQFAKHCVCFTRSSLAVCKDCAIVTIQHILYCVSANRIVNCQLHRLWSKHSIERVDDVWLQQHCVLIGEDAELLGGAIHFGVVEWPESSKHLNVRSVLGHHKAVPRWVETLGHRWLGPLLCRIVRIEQCWDFFVHIFDCYLIKCFSWWLPFNSPPESHKTIGCLCSPLSTPTVGLWVSHLRPSLIGSATRFVNSWHRIIIHTQ